MTRYSSDLLTSMIVSKSRFLPETHLKIYCSLMRMDLNPASRSYLEPNSLR